MSLAAVDPLQAALDSLNTLRSQHRSGPTASLATGMGFDMGLSRAIEVVSQLLSERR